MKNRIVSMVLKFQDRKCCHQRFSQFFATNLLFFLLLWGCSSTPESKPQTVTVPAIEVKSVESTIEKNDPIQKTPTKEETRPGSPVASAVYEMKRSEQEMQKTIEMMKIAQMGDITVDCQRDSKAFQKISTFFHPSYFQYDENSFWFLTDAGLKIKLRPEDGILKTCRYGIFGIGQKQLIARQFKDNSVTETEFYVDEKERSLAVHYYHNGNRYKNENYILAQ